mmetsp:Transcript_40282/g.69447  ORF Transcript_40282/g.69447 Transcript_40282/m.69447 type:complete len:272 (-) Transcript_40282:1054-1869(-)
MKVCLFVQTIISVSRNIQVKIKEISRSNARGQYRHSQLQSGCIGAISREPGSAPSQRPPRAPLSSASAGPTPFPRQRTQCPPSERSPSRSPPSSTPQPSRSGCSSISSHTGSVRRSRSSSPPSSSSKQQGRSPTPVGDQAGPFGTGPWGARPSAAESQEGRGSGARSAPLHGSSRHHQGSASSSSCGGASSSSSQTLSASCSSSFALPSSPPAAATTADSGVSSLSKAAQASGPSGSGESASSGQAVSMAWGGARRGRLLLSPPPTPGGRF